jgi:hypothetical protein
LAVKLGELSNSKRMKHMPLCWLYLLALSAGGADDDVAQHVPMVALAAAERGYQARDESAQQQGDEHSQCHLLTALALRAMWPLAEHAHWHRLPP